ncbi:hypothetical protein [Paraburkholderia sp. BL25I1N1]|uniref:hypothetical protein n=1 Tax=Paraburkholderia sp. BL25I1N1 TaxID=1938804 RepID=UPI000D063BCC|nr:hypothetical protein [Paraburkholderia sp. BL25I1N1]PRY03209.1 hypothetical protein B0G73_11662 [Paraburkholderia sp. BL25I1N1]
MPMKDNVSTWLEPWHEASLDLLSVDMRERVIAELDRRNREVERKQQERETSLNRLAASVDIITSAAISDEPFYRLDKAIDITARAITEALHEVPAEEAHTSEYWAKTLANHRERLRALVELGRLTVFDMHSAGTCVFESGLPDWAQCNHLGLARSGMVDFARCQGVDISSGAHKPEKISKKKQDTMLKVIAALLYLRYRPQTKLAIATEIENWTQSIDGDVAVTARTVTGYIKEIGESLGLSRKDLGLIDRDGAPD